MKRAPVRLRCARCRRVIGDLDSKRPEAETRLPVDMVLVVREYQPHSDRWNPEPFVVSWTIRCKCGMSRRVSGERMLEAWKRAHDPPGRHSIDVGE